VFIEVVKQEKDTKGIILTDQMYNYVTKVSDFLYVIKDCASYRIDDLEKLKNYGYLR